MINRLISRLTKFIAVVTLTKSDRLHRSAQPVDIEILVKTRLCKLSVMRQLRIGAL